MVHTRLHASSKGAGNAFSQAFGHQKSVRAAQASLHCMVTFQQSLDKEIRRTEQSDDELLRKMQIVHDHYHTVMAGFTQKDGDSQRHRLIIYADAIQDLITHAHRSAVSLPGALPEQVLRTWQAAACDLQSAPVLDAAHELMVRYQGKSPDNLAKLLASDMGKLF